MQPTIKTYKAAGYPALWVEALEPQRTARAIYAELPNVFAWDVLTGITSDGTPVMPEAQDPGAAVGWLVTTAPSEAVLVMHNIHLFIGEGNNVNAGLVQAFHNAMALLKPSGKMVIALVPPGVKLPKELDRIFQLCSMPLPDANALGQILDGVLKASGDVLTDEQRQRFVDASVGLTVDEAENAFSLACTAGTPDHNVVASEKATQVRKQGVLTVYQGNESFDGVGGNEQLKGYLKRAIKSPLSKGIVMLGMPGTGKSELAKALGNEAGWTTIRMDVGALFGSLVGESEGNCRRALAVVEAMAPCILFIDEIEKGLAGASGGSNDGGTTSRTLGTLLSWLNDRTARVFVVATSNDVSKLPPEFLRPGRFDATFFLDFPTAAERESIFQIHAKRLGIKESLETAPDLTHWTGAEIAALCRQAVILDLPLCEAAKYITPVHKARGGDMDKLREWASARCVPAASPLAPAQHAPQGARRVVKLN